MILYNTYHADTDLRETSDYRDTRCDQSMYLRFHMEGCNPLNEHW